MSEPSVAEAMGKLTKKEAPLRIQRQKYLVASLRADLERMKQVGGGKAKRAFLLLLFGRRQLPVEAQWTAIEENLAKREADILECVLTPLTEAESWECRARYAEVLHYLATQQPHDELSEEGLASRKFAHELAAGQALQSARVHCMMKDPKRNPDGTWRRYMTSAQVAELDPRLLRDIADIYAREFVLTEAELGK